MKKAFCEPGNTKFCPPIALASAFGFGFSDDALGEVLVKRSPDNGGDVIFKSRAEIEAAFTDESLHPGDLKVTTTALMFETMDKVAKGIKADGEAVKASKALKVLEKKLAKKK
jgi:tyrosyl-tRNA synthetase